MTNSEILNGLFVKYNLVYDSSNPDSKDNDVYKHKHYKIITRTGIQKIEKATEIFCEIDLISSGKDFANVQGRGFLKGTDRNSHPDYITLASANELSVKGGSGYFCEMAEKRCRSRLILTLAGLYELGVFGEDEAESFSDIVKDQQTAKYKGQ